VRVPSLEHFEWQKGVIAMQDSPPASPSRGDSYIVGEGSGDWSGQNGKIAIYDVSGWVFIAPVKGMFCFVKDEDKLYYYVTSWEEFGDECLYPPKTVIAGDILIVSSDEETSTDSTTYIKAKEIKIRSGGELRITFDLRTSYSLREVKGQIYRNGIAVGIERSKQMNTFSTYSEDISGWAKDDLLQLYIKRVGTGASAICQNFRVYVADNGTHFVTQSTVQ
jgi:hypothetical protein